MTNPERNAVKLLRLGGAVQGSKWGDLVDVATTTHFRPVLRWIRRPIPPHCVEVVAKDRRRIETLPRRSREAVEAVLAFYPRTRSLVVVHDWDAVEALAGAPPYVVAYFAKSEEDAARMIDRIRPNAALSRPEPMEGAKDEMP